MKDKERFLPLPDQAPSTKSYSVAQLRVSPSTQVTKGVVKGQALLRRPKAAIPGTSCPGQLKEGRPAGDKGVNGGKTRGECRMRKQI